MGGDSVMEITPEMRAKCERIYQKWCEAEGGGLLDEWRRSLILRELAPEELDMLKQWTREPCKKE